MIFDYILNNRFYIQNDDAASPQEEKTNPLADVIPTAPHNRLETFLNMIVGDTFKVPSAGYVVADPIKPISEMEYWLNEIAAAKDGNPWKDAAGKFVAKKISIKIGEDPAHIFYSLTIDTGLKDFPYEMFGVKVEANECEYSTIAAATVTAENVKALSDEVKNGDVFASPDPLMEASASPSVNGDNINVFQGDPGLWMDSILVLFIKNGTDTIKTQTLMTFSKLNDHDFVPYDNEADELIFDTFDLKFVEVKEEHGNV